MSYKPTGKPPGRPRLDGAPAGSNKEPTMAKADEPATPLTQAPVFAETPEFKEAVAAAAASAAATAVAAAMEAQRTSMMAEMVTVLTKASQPGGPAIDMPSLISDLTVAIAGMADTGDNRKKISPAEANKRIEATVKMGEMLERIHSDTSLKPHYEIVAETFLDEQMIQKYVPASEGKWKTNQVIWRGAPNTAMKPMNDIAKQLYALYLASIGGTTKNQSGVRDHPTWVGYGGLQMVGVPSQSAVNRGLVAQPADPIELGVDLHDPMSEITSVDDPNASRIPILGKSFAPATRVAPGDQATLQFPPS